MMSKLWGWIAFAFMTVVSLALLFMGQRDKAREAKHKADVKLATSEATRNTENKIREAQQQARQQSVETEKKRDERPKTQRPSGSLRRD